jgi:hydroxypyruvate reductase
MTVIMKESKPGDRLEQLRQTSIQIFEEALQACSLSHAFASRITMSDPHRLHLEGDGEIDLSSIKRIIVISMGKGAANMLDVLLSQPNLTADREVSGILIAPQRPESLRDGVAFYAGGHPTPNEHSFEAARAALELLRTASHDNLAAETFCFFLISGGASAMMELPLDSEITLEDTIAFHRALVHSGASIAEINCVRKHFSAVKGGRLALAATSLRSLTIAVSDVPAGQLDVLASGPTLPDSSTIADCKRILAQYQLLVCFPESVRRYFESSDLAESPKPGEIVPRVYALLSSEHFAQAAQESAERRGFRTFIDNSCDDWDYREAADYLLGRMRDLQRQYGSICLISAGEVTVRLPADNAASPKSRAGGRNLHFALYSASQLRDLEDIAVLSAGSDGIDGNSPAAGAAVDRTTIRTRSEAETALQEFASFDYLNEAGAVIITGPTGNNLRDLRILLS